MSLFDADLLFLNHDSCLPLLMAGEGEVESGVQPRRLARLEDVRRNWPFLRDRRIDAYAGLDKRLRD